VRARVAQDLGFDSRQRQDIFPISTTFRLALRPTQPSI
jgi:hypothetical protein